MTIETVESEHGTRKHIVQSEAELTQGYEVYCGDNRFTGPTEEHDSVDGLRGLCRNCEHIYKSSKQ